MELHWIIISVIIVGIVLFQLVVFRRTLKRLKAFKRVFPERFGEEWLVETTNGCSQFVLIAHKKDLDEIEKCHKERIAHVSAKEELEKNVEFNIELGLPYKDMVKQVEEEKMKINALDRRVEEIKKNSKYNQYFTSNPTLKTIIESINVYLKKNKGNSIDYHLIKDIVDRNCDAIEEEIQAQLPMPLYAGLAGTMSGIIIGVGYLVISKENGLKALLSTSENSSEGVKALLGGVALAMIASIFGIVFTTIGSWRSKSVMVEVEQGKQRFLSWLQQELLPKLKTGVDAEIGKITDNIKKSNTSFAENTTKLNKTLGDINQAVSGMTGMLQSLQGLNIVQIAHANIEVYDKLKNCTDEIGKFAQYIESLDSFIAKVDLLSNKMGEADDRVRAIEEMGQYFIRERSSLEAMRGLISSSIGQADANLKNSVDVFKESTSKSYQEMANHNEIQRQNLQKAIDEQQELLVGKLKEKASQLDFLSDELKKLSPIKDSVSNFEKATREQNKKIDELTSSIRDLARTRVEGGNGGGGRLRLPGWAKWLLIISGVTVSLTCLAFWAFVVLSFLDKAL